MLTCPVIASRTTSLLRGNLEHRSPSHPSARLMHERELHTRSLYVPGRTGNTQTQTLVPGFKNRWILFVRTEITGGTRRRTRGEGTCADQIRGCLASFPMVQVVARAS